MTSAMITSGGVVTVDQKNTYTGDGTRIAKDENGRKTQYYYDGNGLLYTAASESADTLLEGQSDAGEPFEDNIADLGDDRYITALNFTGTSGNVIASARYDGEESFCFYNKDGRESTTNILDSEGKAGASYTYTTFGETAKLTGSIANEICYCGSIYDETTALYYLKSRYYDPSEGVFLTADDEWGEAKDALSLNRYAYCQDNPVTYTDPDGHFPIWAEVGSAMGAHDGYRYAKRRGYRGWRRAACIVGGAALGAVNPFKCLRVARHARTAYKVARKFKRTRSAYKRARKVYKSVTKRPRVKAKIAKRKVTHKARKVRCKVTGKGCFTAGTLISTDDGEIPIEDIEEGDLVWSQDPETGEVSLKEVLEVYVKESDEILHITAGEEEIEATPNHVFYTEEHGWIPAAYLEEGDGLMLQSGETVTVSEISVEHFDRSVPVYNFEVDAYHTYFVSGTRVLVHNQSKDCGEKVHGNSLKTKKKTELYVLRDKTTGKVMKIGETTRGKKRYSKRYYNKHNVEMQTIAVGSKRDMHFKQHRLLKKYKKKVGKLPKLNKSLW